MLCANCQAIADGWPSYDRTYLTITTFKHYNSRAEVEASAEEGCCLCVQFLQVILPDHYRYENDKHPAGHVEVWSEGRRGMFPQQIETRWSLNYKLVWRNDIFEIAVVHAVPTVKPIKIHTTSKESLLEESTREGLPLVKEWLQTCCKIHKGCKSAERAYVPTRLIAISNEPRLRIFGAASSPVDYATLSHCWGKLRLPTLTKDSLEEFKSRIPAAALSKTFQEAIQTARYLGLRYIWIDSLCIIQDDSDDWHHESRLMTDVYGSSKVNIAASGAADGSEGCFFQRTRSWRCQLVGPKGILVECFAHKLCGEVLDEMPLSTRGWALQERLLPHRNLFMAKTQLFWQCATSEACEILPTFPKESSKNPLTGFEYLCFDGRTEISRETWNLILGRYMRCQITESQDKLVAIAGLARFIHDKTGEAYIAGLWMNDIENQICWQIREPQPGSTSFAYRAPSWSWAATDAVVFWSGKWFDDANFRVISTHIQHEQLNDPFGRVSSASLRIQCSRLLSLTVERIGDEKYCFSHNGIKIHLRITLDCKESMSDDLRHDLLILFIYHSFEGLLLRASGCRRGEYRRIGYFEGLEVEQSDEVLELYRAYIADPANCPDEILSETNILEDGSLQRVIILI